MFHGNIEPLYLFVSVAFHGCQMMPFDYEMLYQSAVQDRSRVFLIYIEA